MERALYQISIIIIIYILLYIHKYIHTNIHKCIGTYIQCTYIHACSHKCNTSHCSYDELSASKWDDTYLSDLTRLSPPFPFSGFQS